MAMVRKLLVYLWGTFHPSLKRTKAALRVTVTKEMGPFLIFTQSDENDDHKTS